jgi:hypothetical protein
MTTLTLTLPDHLAERLKPISRWLPHILEIGLLKIKTPAAEMASEIVEFLASNPSNDEVANFHASARASQRVQTLLELNRSGNITEEQTQELDEVIKLEMFIRDLKVSLAKSTIA